MGLMTAELARMHRQDLLDEACRDRRASEARRGPSVRMVPLARAQRVTDEIDDAERVA